MKTQLIIWSYNITDFIWNRLYEYITDFTPSDKERLSGTLKPTRFARFIYRICIRVPAP